MIFPADVKVDADHNVWMISDRMPNFLIATLDFTDINFRIFTAKLDDLIADTICDPRISAHSKNLLSSPYDDSSLLVNSLSHGTYSSHHHAPVYHTPTQQIYPQPANYYHGKESPASHSGHGHTWGQSADEYSNNYHFSLEGGHVNRFW